MLHVPYISSSFSGKIGGSIEEGKIIVGGRLTVKIWFSGGGKYGPQVWGYFTVKEAFRFRELTSKNYVSKFSPNRWS